MNAIATPVPITTGEADWVFLQIVGLALLAGLVLFAFARRSAARTLSPHRELERVDEQVA